MRHSKLKQVETKVDEAIECDVCHEKYLLGYVENENPKNFSHRVSEIQEFVHIYHSCGYGSIFGDETEYELDICQGCMSRLFGLIIMKRKY